MGVESKFTVLQHKQTTVNMMRLRSFILLCCLTTVLCLEGETDGNDYTGTTETQGNERADPAQAKQKRYWPYDTSTFGYGYTKPVKYADFSLSYGSYGDLYLHSLGNYVCDYGFNYDTAKMICRSLGYASVINYYRHGYSSHVTPKLHCSWPYYYITSCYWGERCPSHNRIYIDCQEQTTVEASTLRYNTNSLQYTNFGLTSGSYGYLQSYDYGRYVCSYGFDYSRAEIICRSLGYGSAGYFYTDSNNAYYTPRLLCNWPYNNLSDCYWGGSCPSSGRIHMSCQELTTVAFDTTTFNNDLNETTPVRLVGGTYGWEGRVEVYHNGEWGTVCDDGFGNPEAKVVCRMLGYDYRYKVTYHSSYGGGSGPIWMDDVNCNGFEADIASCQFGSWGHHNCGHGEDVGVSCLDDFSTSAPFTAITPETWTTELGSHIPIQFVNGQQVQVYHNGVWGAICMDGFGWNEAHAICRQQGYSYANGYSLLGSTGSPATYTIWLDHLNCPYNAYSLSSCTASPWGSQGCSIYNSITLTCDRYTTTPYSTFPSYRTTTGSYCNGYSNFCHNGGTCHGGYYGRYCSCHTGFTGRYCETLIVENEINVQCLDNSWQIRLYIPSLHQAYTDFRNNDIYLGRDSCTGRQMGNYLIFTQDYTDCGTSEVTTSDKIVYSNELVYAVHDPNYHFITKEYRFRLKTDCYISRNEGSGSEFYHNYQVTDSEHHVTNSGHHYVNLAFYSDPQFTHVKPLYGSKVGDNVYVKAYTDLRNYNIKMRLDDCYTKPTRYGSDAYRFYLLRDGCPIDPTVHVLSESTHETRFVFQDFEYVTNHDSLYLFCNASFCDSGDYSPSCERRCLKNRNNMIQASLRSGPFETNEVVDIVRNNTKKGIGYMTVLDPSPPNVRVVQSPMLIAVSAVCVAIVICVSLVLIIRRRRARLVRPSKQGGANAVLHF